MTTWTGCRLAFPSNASKPATSCRLYSDRRLPHHGIKRNIKNFKSHSILKLFDEHFHKSRLELLLAKTGLSIQSKRSTFSRSIPGWVRRFRYDFSYFEKTRSSRGVYKVADGVTCDAIFSMREILKELPKRFLENPSPLSTRDFISCHQVQ